MTDSAFAFSAENTSATCRSEWDLALMDLTLGVDYGCQQENDATMYVDRFGIARRPTMSLATRALA